MNSVEDKPAILTYNGNRISCATDYVNAGGHRLAPGFYMRGYSTGTRTASETQLIYVECADAEGKPGSKPTIPYTYVTGQYNYYEQDKNKVEANLEMNLDEAKTDLVYPITEDIEGLIQQADIEIVAINKVVLTQTGVQRPAGNPEFTWKTYNPDEYPSYVHIGNPPVIGDEGVLYGFNQTPEIISVPITPAGGTAEWMTEVSVPPDIKGLYILLSVETGKARLFVNYAIDITNQ